MERWVVPRFQKEMFLKIKFENCLRVKKIEQLLRYMVTVGMLMNAYHEDIVKYLKSSSEHEEQ
jgi:hypothetical protein